MAMSFESFVNTTLPLRPLVFSRFESKSLKELESLYEKEEKELEELRQEIELRRIENKSW